MGRYTFYTVPPEVHEKKTVFERIHDVDPERIDNCIPLGIKLLSRVQFDLAQYDLNAENINMTRPFESGTVIEIGVNRFNTDAYHLVDYVVRIRPDDSNYPNCLLVIETDSSDVLATKIFTLHSEFTPMNDDEWDVWFHHEDGIFFSDTMNTPEGKVLNWTWSTPATGPFETNELVYCDKYGTITKKFAMKQAMFNDEYEFALVSHVSSSYIEVSYGININPTAITVIG